MKISFLHLKQILVIAVLCPGFMIFSQSNSDLNQKGISALKKKDFTNAEKYFKQTLEVSPNDAFANYNLACTYSLQIAQCDQLEKEDEVLQLLEKAIQSKPSYKLQMLRDKDLDIMKGKYRFYELVGLVKKKIFSKLVWYGPGMGMYGPMDQISFQENGKFIYSKLADRDGEIGKEVFTGKYEWQSESILLLQFEKKAPISNSKKKLKVKYEKGVLEIEGFEHSFTNSPSRCDA